LSEIDDMSVSDAASAMSDRPPPRSGSSKGVAAAAHAPSGQTASRATSATGAAAVGDPQSPRQASLAVIERPSRRSRKTSRALVEAARALLEEQGVGALTVKAVTERAEVGHGTFYHHFPSTEAVLAAGIQESMREFAQAIEHEFSDSPDKAWVFVASLSSTFRMLVSHPAIAWMLERPQLLAASLLEACAPFARRDIEAMVTAGDVRANTLATAGRYWEWLIVGALMDASEHPSERNVIESRLVGIVLRILGFDEHRLEGLLHRLDASRRPGD
jgi:AcrR family transcriptional regulator